VDEVALPSRAEIVVVGGGVAGCSVAYHLSQLGIADVLLLEQGRLAGGTTWHSVGVVSQLRSSRTLTEMSLSSIALYRRLEAQTGVDPGWVQCGGLAVARTPERMVQLNRASALGRYWGVDTGSVSVQEAADLWPSMTADDLVGAVWSPGDGKVNAVGLTHALAKGARLRGAKIAERTRATGLRVQRNRVSGVVVEGEQTIECDVLVICGGYWSKVIGEWAGVTVPLFPAEHFYVVTDAVEGIRPHMPAVRDPDGWTYFKDEGAGLLVGGFEPIAKPWIDPKDIPYPFEFQLLPDNWEQFKVIFSGACRRLPVLETVGIKKMYNGPESFTPDGGMLLGQAPHLRNCYLACGFNSSGVGLAGGLGEVLAQWVEDGEPPCDVTALDVRRFAPFHGNSTWLRERVAESVGFHFSVPWPNREATTGRGLRRSAVHEKLRRAGASFGAKMGWERANWYAPPGVAPTVEYSFGRQNWWPYVRREHEATRARVSLFDLSSFAKFTLKGPDAGQVLQQLCSNDIGVRPGRIVYTAMLNDRAGYVSDLTVTRVAEYEYLIVTGAGQATADFDYLETAVADCRAEVIDVTSDYAVLAVMGPLSRTLLGRLSSSDLRTSSFAFGESHLIDVGGCTCRASRITNVGELGWELYVPAGMACALYEQLLVTGEDLGLTHAGYYALDSLRLEKGYRAWGRELSPDVTPAEAGLLFTCKLRSGLEFRGRDALKAQIREGMYRRLVSITVGEPEAVIWGGEVVLRDGIPVGATTSGAFGYTIGKPVGFAFLRREEAPIENTWITSGSYEVDIAGHRFPADVYIRAPYDPAGTRVRE
jgi:glycine cleavage system aminomethyltransferase T/glycine/D-amino acid oxidase-like deaminating enzyme